MTFVSRSSTYTKHCQGNLRIKLIVEDYFVSHLDVQKKLNQKDRAFRFGINKDINGEPSWYLPSHQYKQILRM